MSQGLYSIRDAKAEAWLTPFHAVTHGVAMRMFEQAVNDEHHDFHRNAADYSLWYVGEFDPATATLVPAPPAPNCMAQAVELLEREV